MSGIHGADLIQEAKHPRFAMIHAGMPVNRLHMTRLRMPRIKMSVPRWGFM